MYWDPSPVQAVFQKKATKNTEVRSPWKNSNSHAVETKVDSRSLVPELLTQVDPDNAQIPILLTNNKSNKNDKIIYITRLSGLSYVSNEAAYHSALSIIHFMFQPFY